VSQQPVNFNDLLKAADDAGFSVVPANEYEAEVATAEAKTTSGGKNQIVVRFKIIAGPQAGKSVFNNFVISPDNANALGFFFRHMAAMGLEREYFAANPPLSQAAAQLIGRKVTITVSIEQWNGQDRNRVNAIKKAGMVSGVGATPFIPQAMPPAITSLATPAFVPQPPSVPTASFVPEPVPPLNTSETQISETKAPEVPF
jgi:hypothetical protein